MPTSSSAHSHSIGSGLVAKPEVPSKPHKPIKWRPTFASRISRYYQTPLASSSKFLAMKWDIRTYLKHRMAINNVKSGIDQAPPRSFAHLSLDLRKLRNEEVRLTDIERDNRILLQKMSYTFRTNPSLDNMQDPRLNIIKTLGKVRIERDIVRITSENLAILEYLMQTRPVYSVKNLLRQWQIDKKVMTVNARFPFGWDERDRLFFPKPERPDTRYLQTVLTPLKKRRDRIRVERDEIAVDVNGNPFPPMNRRLKTSIKLEEAMRRRTPKTSKSIAETDKSDIIDDSEASTKPYDSLETEILDA